HGEFGVSASDWTGTESLERQRRCGEPDWRMAAEWHSDGEDGSSGEYHGDPESRRHAGWQQQEPEAGPDTRGTDLSGRPDHQHVVQPGGVRHAGKRNLG